MMFITKFNGMIRNRIVWGIIAFIVVMAFVVWGTQTEGDGSAGDGDLAGKLNGQNITRREFRNAYFSTYLSMCLNIGRRLNINQEMDVILDRMAWKRVVSLKKAAEMGVAVSGDEVAAAIRGQEFFAVEGHFSPQRYEWFVNGFLADLGAIEPQFEEFIRQEAVLNKLRRFVDQSVWISDSDVLHAFHQLYDTFVVEYVMLAREEFEHMVEITEDAARIVFTDDPSRFVIPEMVSVKFVAFPAESFIDDLVVSDELLLECYDEYISKSIASGDDEWDSVPLLEDVEDEVRLIAARKAAAEIALDKAYSFELALTPDRSGRSPVFESVAADMGIQVYTSSFFAVKEKVEGLDVSLDFNEAAFNLRSTAESSFSYPIKLAETIYVLGYNDRRESRIPDFEEVKDVITLVARDQAVKEKLKELSDEVHSAINNDLRKGVSFSESAALFGLEVLAMEPFTISSAFSDQDYADDSYMLMRYVLSRNEGEITDIIPVEKGFLIGYVVSRESGSTAAFEVIRDEIVEYIRRRREETAFDAWQAYLLNAARFEDRLPAKQLVPEDADEEEDFS